MPATSRLSADSLELLCLTIVSCRDARGKQLTLQPKDVLQPWVVEQLPKRYHAGTFEEAYENVTKGDAT